MHATAHTTECTTFTFFWKRDRYFFWAWSNNTPCTTPRTACPSQAVQPMMSSKRLMDEKAFSKFTLLQRTLHFSFVVFVTSKTNAPFNLKEPPLTNPNFMTSFSECIPTSFGNHFGLRQTHSTIINSPPHTHTHTPYERDTAKEKGKEKATHPSQQENPLEHTISPLLADNISFKTPFKLVQ